MNAKSAVFALVSIRSHPLRRLVNRLPYAPSTVYNAVSQLEEENKVENKKGIINVVEDYPAQKLSEIYVRSLIHGIDPEFITRESTQSIWKSLEDVSTVHDIMKETGYSAVSVKKILTYLKDKGLVVYSKKKPIVAHRDMEHPLNELLKDYLRPEKETRTMRYPGSIPFREIMETPDEVERILYQHINDSFTVKDTGFLVKGNSDRITILESVEKELTNEEIFLKKLFTTDGVGDLCILMIKQKQVDHDKLFELAKDKNVVNVVGCYFDVLNSIDDIIPTPIVKKYLEYEPKKKKTFLSQEKRYGKQGWEDPFEERWNVDLYLDIDVISHGVRSL